jgi:hypothetical protein
VLPGHSTPRTRPPCVPAAHPHRLRGDHNSWGTPCHFSRARCCPTTAWSRRSARAGWG